MTAQALEYLARLFGRRSGIGIYMATRALAGAVPADTVEALSTRYVSELEKLL